MLREIQDHDKTCKQKGKIMKNLELQKCILGSVYTNCYFLKNKTTGELLIIDPADAPERIVSKVNEMQATPVAILLTHGHFDHIMAADAVRKKYGISVYACSEEVETLQNARSQSVTVSWSICHTEARRSSCRSSGS